MQLNKLILYPPCPLHHSHYFSGPKISHSSHFKPAFQKLDMSVSMKVWCRARSAARSASRRGAAAYGDAHMWLKSPFSLQKCVGRPLRGNVWARSAGNVGPLRG